MTDFESSGDGQVPRSNSVRGGEHYGHVYRSVSIETVVDPAAVKIACGLARQIRDAVYADEPFGDITVVKVHSDVTEKAAEFLYTSSAGGHSRLIVGPSDDEDKLRIFLQHRQPSVTSGVIVSHEGLVTPEFITEEIRCEAEETGGYPTLRGVLSSEPPEPLGLDQWCTELQGLAGARGQEPPRGGWLRRITGIGG